MKIGIFDSGMGGLAILREIVKILPEYDYIYLGDNARVPYGGRSEDLIYKLVRSAVEFLFKKECLLVILACNTATAAALKRLQHEYLPQNYPSRRILGIIRPTVEYINETGFTRVGVIGTYQTVKSGRFEKELHKLNSQIKVYQYACPLLASCIEEGETHEDLIKHLLTHYLQPFAQHRIECLVLGCTHYGIIDESIFKFFGGKIVIANEGPIAASKLTSYIIRHPELKNKLGKHGKRQLFVTDISERYKHMATQFLGDLFSDSEKLELVHL